MLTHGLHGAHGETPLTALEVGETHPSTLGVILLTDGPTGEVADLAV